jgi:hypothetical protein
MIKIYIPALFKNNSKLESLRLSAFYDKNNYKVSKYIDTYSS